MNQRTKKLTMIAMLSAMAYVVMMVCRIPVAGFLTYDPKDVLVVIGGFLFGPLISVVISLVVSFLEMITVSDTGVIGWIMNFIASVTFAGAAALIYKKKHTLTGAFWGLLGGSILMTAMMLLWNYLITPIYLNMPRSEVAKMILPILLPFNLLKCGLNMAITLLLYKPVVTAFRKVGLVKLGETNKRNKLGMILFAGLLLVTCILFLFVWQGMI